MTFDLTHPVHTAIEMLVGSQVSNYCGLGLGSGLVYRGRPILSQSPEVRELIKLD